MAVDRERVAALVRELLEAIGEDPDRPGLRLTPERVADAYAEFFSGVGEDAAAPLAHTISVARGPAPETLPSGAVMLRDIRFRSVCEHHLLPFRGHAHIAYLPGEQVVGLGALPEGRRDPRVAPAGAGAARASRSPTRSRHPSTPAACSWCSMPTHECVTMRGDRQPDASTVTIAARGELVRTGAHGPS